MRSRLVLALLAITAMTASGCTRRVQSASPSPTASDTGSVAVGVQWAEGVISSLQGLEPQIQNLRTAAVNIFAAQPGSSAATDATVALVGQIETQIESLVTILTQLDLILNDGIVINQQGGITEVPLTDAVNASGNRIAGLRTVKQEVLDLKAVVAGKLQPEVLSLDLADIAARAKAFQDFLNLTDAIVKSSMAIRADIGTWPLSTVIQPMTSPSPSTSPVALACSALSPDTCGSQPAQCVVSGGFCVDRNSPCSVFAADVCVQLSDRCLPSGQKCLDRNASCESFDSSSCNQTDRCVSVATDPSNPLGSDRRCIDRTSPCSSFDANVCSQFSDRCVAIASDSNSSTSDRRCIDKSSGCSAFDESSCQSVAGDRCIVVHPANQFASGSSCIDRSSSCSAFTDPTSCGAVGRCKPVRFSEVCSCVDANFIANCDGLDALQCPSTCGCVWSGQCSRG